MHNYITNTLFLAASVLLLPLANCFASPRMPPLNDPSASSSLKSDEQPQQHTLSTSDYGVRKNHPTAYNEDPPFKGPLHLSDASSPSVHRQRIRRHYMDMHNDDNNRTMPTIVSSPLPPLQLHVSDSTDTILTAIVNHLAYRDAPVDVKEVAESIEFYLRSGKRLLGAAKRIAKSNSNSSDTTRRTIIQVQDLCSGHGLTGMLFAACNPPRRSASAIPVHAVMVDQVEPPSHAILRDCIAEICPWIGEEGAVKFIPSTLEEFALNNESDSTSTDDDDTTLIVISTHACGSLTDKVLEHAIKGQAAAIAVMPCCYTGTDKGAPYGIKRALGVGMAADVRRSFYLQEQGGYHVDFATIPRAITPLNRIILAERRK